MLHRFRWFLYAFVFVLALAPIAGALLTAMLAPLLGCEVNEAIMSPGLPCTVFGFDMSGLLASLLLAGGVGQLTIPILIAVLGFWGIVEGLLFLYGRRRARSLDAGDASDA